MQKQSLKTNRHSIIILILLAVAVFTLSGFTISTVKTDLDPVYPPIRGEEGEGTDPGKSEEGASSEHVNVIKNGGFERRDTNPLNGVALDWMPFKNGQADFGWYDETWPEAVSVGEHAQLMEIAVVESDILDRVVAVYQTVDVAPKATYDLTIHALMRVEAPANFRNKFEYEMNWGVDFSGEGNYNNVEEWNFMPLVEQFRLGSHGEPPEDIPLFYEIINGTIQTENSNKITLFIRGVKKFPSLTEVNFDIDEVTLTGPSPATQTDKVISAPEEATSMPDTGLILPGNISIGALIMGSVLLIILGSSAVASLLQDQKET